MKLTQKEHERLILFNVAEIARDDAGGCPVGLGRCAAASAGQE